MMVDLDDDPEWSVQDEIEDEDEERFLKFMQIQDNENF
jgi:hypothetical protein